MYLSRQMAIKSLELIDCRISFRQARAEVNGHGDPDDTNWHGPGQGEVNTPNRFAVAERRP